MAAARTAAGHSNTTTVSKGVVPRGAGRARTQPTFGSPKVASVQESTRSDPTSGTKLAAIADALVKLHKDVCGRGPTNARCFASGNAVVCLLYGGLTRGERTLLESGDLV